MKLWALIFLSLFNVLHAAYFQVGQEVVVIVPVADAVGNPLAKFDSSMRVQEVYDQLPYSYEVGSRGCLRLHQLLFNERYKVAAIFGEEIELKTNNFVYIADKKVKNTVWTLKRNVRPLASGVYQRRIDITAIPAPFRSGDGIIHLDTILTLKEPWFDALTGKAYSAGTRFVRNIGQDTAADFAIFILDTKNYKKHVTFVGKRYALVDYPKSPQAAIDLFLSLLRSWADPKKGVIPYVWGGASYIDRIKKNDFFLVSKRYLDQDVQVWQRPGQDSVPHTGCECSSLILRLTQMCGMPYIYKNTAALSTYLRPLKKGEALENGDLIWYSGHVVIVSDIARNLITETVGYMVGYGILHTIPLGALLKGIKTYSQLVDAYHQKKSLVRLNSKGGFGRSVNDFKLLKLSSIYSPSPEKLGLFHE